MPKVNVIRLSGFGGALVEINMSFWTEQQARQPSPQVIVEFRPKGVQKDGTPRNLKVDITNILQDQDKELARKLFALRDQFSDLVHGIRKLGLDKLHLDLLREPSDV